MHGEIAGRERVIHRGGDVGERVDEGSVEIENDKAAMQDRNSSRKSSTSPSFAADAPERCAPPLVVESAILSPGVDGHVFNPIVVAEFRRWRARPVTYLGIVLLTLLGIVFLHYGRGAAAPFGITHPVLVGIIRHFAEVRQWVLEPFGTGKFGQLAAYGIDLLFRPSTILPLMMVWRALLSFREGGLYKPFRTTFLTPSEFLWGMIAVPFSVSALLLVLYTGGVLGPGLVQAYEASAGRSGYPLLHIAGILFEGSLNGALICFVALYAALLLDVRWSSLAPVLLAILAIQGLQAWFLLERFEVLAWLQTKIVGGEFLDPFAEPEGMQRVFMLLSRHQHLFFLFVSGILKLALCTVLWALCRIAVRRTEDEAPAGRAGIVGAPQRA